MGRRNTCGGPEWSGAESTVVRRRGGTVTVDHPFVLADQAMNSSSSRSSFGFGCAPTIDLTTSPLT